MNKLMRVAAGFGCALSLSAQSIAATPLSRPAPGCPLSLSQGPASLKQLAGKVVYLDFWASWCVACLASFPFMERLQQEFGPKGLEVVAVNMDQKPADAQHFLAGHRVTFSVAMGRNEACAKQFGVNAMPSTFIIDRRGVVRAVHESFRPSDASGLRAIVQKLLAEPRA